MGFHAQQNATCIVILRVELLEDTIGHGRGNRTIRCIFILDRGSAQQGLAELLMVYLGLECLTQGIGDGTLSVRRADGNKLADVIAELGAHLLCTQGQLADQ